MLTKVTIRNFKRFREVEVELGNPVVLIGPTNSGKTTALQALALWNIGVRRWLEKRSGKGAPEKRPGVTINRRDLIAMPVPDANLLWRDLHVRDVTRVGGKQQTKGVRVDIVVEGVTAGNLWTCGVEFDYANQESFYCRPLRLPEEEGGGRMPVPMEAGMVDVAFLPPMSGLAASETRLTNGAINVLLGEGRTAEVLRNLCHMILQREDGAVRWRALTEYMSRLFGVTLEEPSYVAIRGEITMRYRAESGAVLDLSASGRGMQQTLLLLAYLHANPGAVLLLDEPDAHLEILRQRQIYEILSTTAGELGSQIVAASHSEVILNEAADRDVVVAFVGRPHRIDDRGSQLLKSLKEIGFEQYYQAEQTGWVLYLEGSTDRAMLLAFARVLDHPAASLLERPFVHYVENQPEKAYSHFYGIREAKPDLVGIAIFDRLERDLDTKPDLSQRMWARREIENYLASPQVLLRWAEGSVSVKEEGPLFAAADKEERRRVMDECIGDLVPRAALRDPNDRWWVDTKISDQFLDRVFEAFYRNLGLPDLMRKTDYHGLAAYVLRDEVSPDIVAVLDEIVRVKSRATPAEEDAGA